MGKFDQYGDPVELGHLDKKDSERLLAFNVTKQKVVERANELAFGTFPWEPPKDYSTWHRALDGKDARIEVVQALEQLLDDQIKDPRKYLPGPPTDDLADWMKQVAGMKWWHQVLDLDMPVNTLTGWASGRGIGKERLERVRERVSEWWSRVDAACTQAERFNRVYRRSCSDVESWDTFLSDYMADGHTVDEARQLYIDMHWAATNSNLDCIDLSNPGPVVTRLPTFDNDQVREITARHVKVEFDKLLDAGFPRASPRTFPPGADLTPYEREGRWGDRRIEEGPQDVNQELHKLWYRERVERYWDQEARAVRERSEIVAVSRDGETWQDPTERQRQGWYHPGLEIAKWRAEHHGDSPDNAYQQAVDAARRKLTELRRYQEARRRPYQYRDDVVMDRAVRAAEDELAAAQNDY